MGYKKGYCGICKGKHRATINALLRDGRSVSSVVKEFNFFRDVVERHIEICGIEHGSMDRLKKEYEDIRDGSTDKIGVTLPSSIEAKRIELNVSTISENIKVLYTSCLQVMAKAEEKDSDRLKLSAIKEARLILEMVIRASALVLEKRDDTDWQEVLELILVALEPFPEAKEAVSNALNKIL